MKATKWLELERRLQEPAFLAGAAWAAEEAAKVVETGSLLSRESPEYKLLLTASAAIRKHFGAIRKHYDLLTEEETK